MGKLTDERARLVACANEHAARFDVLHSWAIATNRGMALSLGIAAGVGVDDFYFDRAPWPVLVAGLSTVLPMWWLCDYCQRRARLLLDEIQRIRDEVCVDDE